MYIATGKMCGRTGKTRSLKMKFEWVLWLVHIIPSDSITVVGTVTLTVQK